jgi:hypothetical protein
LLRDSLERITAQRDNAPAAQGLIQHNARNYFDSAS